MARCLLPVQFRRRPDKRLGEFVDGGGRRRQVGRLVRASASSWQVDPGITPPLSATAIARPIRVRAGHDR
jgi:hypothetical protein